MISLMTISGFLSGEQAPEHTLEGLEKGLEHRDVSCKLAHREDSAPASRVPSALDVQSLMDRLSVQQR